MLIGLRILVVGCSLSAWAPTAWAQSTIGTGAASAPPVIGATPGIKLPKNQTVDTYSNRKPYQRLDSSGRPCLTVGAYARAYASNPNLYDHVMHFENRCAKLISASVCYFNSTSCITVDVPGYQRKESILGIQPSMRDFRFEVREKP